MGVGILLRFCKIKKPVNRGFINGPFCTIYGFGAVSVYLILKDFVRIFWCST